MFNIRHGSIIKAMILANSSVLLLVVLLSQYDVENSCVRLIRGIVDCYVCNM